LLAALGVAAIAIACGCVTEPTQALVEVGTNVPPQVPFRVRVFVRHGVQTVAPGINPDYEFERDGANTSGPDRDAGGSAGALDGGATSGDAGLDAGTSTIVRVVPFPTSLGVVPTDGGPRDEEVTILLEGVTPIGTIRRARHLRFVPNQRLTVAVFFNTQCLAADTRCHAPAGCTVQAYCEEMGQTCGDDGQCVATDAAVGPGVRGPDDRCVPHCTTASCGAYDGCGGICPAGTCATGEPCVAGHCQCAAGAVECGNRCVPGAAVPCQPWQLDTQPCGQCGQALRVCTTACQWQDSGTCANEGPCMPGATRSQACGNCGNQSATCGATCQWGGWNACAGEGVCTPRTTQPGGCDWCSQQTCTDACQWSGCALRPGSSCEWQSGTNYRSCTDRCLCGLEYCVRDTDLGRCGWSGACSSFCNGMSRHQCVTTGTCTGCPAPRVSAE
jgi:hypothetical protein